MHAEVDPELHMVKPAQLPVLKKNVPITLSYMNASVMPVDIKMVVPSASGV
jgi:hypothetical protein